MEIGAVVWKLPQQTGRRQGLPAALAFALPPFTVLFNSRMAGQGGYGGFAFDLAQQQEQIPLNPPFTKGEATSPQLQ